MDSKGDPYFPAEILLLIFSFVDSPNDVFALAMVSKQFNILSINAYLERISYTMGGNLRRIYFKEDMRVKLRALLELLEDRMDNITGSRPTRIRPVELSRELVSYSKALRLSLAHTSLSKISWQCVSLRQYLPHLKRLVENLETVDEMELDFMEAGLLRRLVVADMDKDQQASFPAFMTSLVEALRGKQCTGLILRNADFLPEEMTHVKFAGTSRALKSLRDKLFSAEVKFRRKLKDPSLPALRHSPNFRRFARAFNSLTLSNLSIHTGISLVDFGRCGEHERNWISIFSYIEIPTLRKLTLKTCCIPIKEMLLFLYRHPLITHLRLQARESPAQKEPWLEFPADGLPALKSFSANEEIIAHILRSRGTGLSQLEDLELYRELTRRGTLGRQFRTFGTSSQDTDISKFQSPTSSISISLSVADGFLSDFQPRSLKEEVTEHPILGRAQRMSLKGIPRCWMTTEASSQADFARWLAQFEKVKELTMSCDRYVGVPEKEFAAVLKAAIPDLRICMWQQGLW